MKLTWFGNTSFRIQIGGQIVVIDAQASPGDIDQNELVSGADHVAPLAGEHAHADGGHWKPRARERLLDAGDAVRPLQLWSLGPGSLLVDGDEDGPLLLLIGPIPQLGRWMQEAVVVLAGENFIERGTELLGASAPRLIALAGNEVELDEAFAELPSKLDGTGLVALEPGLAVEV